MISCARCTWRPTKAIPATWHPPMAGPLVAPRLQLAWHAADAGHPLCCVCSTSLTDTEPQTCAACVTEARVALALVVELYALLPGELGHPKGAAYDPVRQGDRERPLMGGDVLALLGPGSTGRTQVAGAPIPGKGLNDEHQADERPGDPQSVAHELARWEDDWRKTRGEPGAELHATRVKLSHRWWLTGALGPLTYGQMRESGQLRASREVRTIASATSYLHKHLAWAGNTHPAFEEFAADLQQLVRRLERVTGRALPEETGAPCFECREPLVRQWTDDGLSDTYSCPRCRRMYTPAEYWLAVRAQYEGAREHGKMGA